MVFLFSIYFSLGYFFMCGYQKIMMTCSFSYSNSYVHFVEIFASLYLIISETLWKSGVISNGLCDLYIQ